MTKTPTHGARSVLTRRRLITVSAASAIALLPGGVAAATGQVTWRGVALGAEAQIQLAHADRQLARKVLKTCISEIRRLEQLFSLYQTGSALNRLNRDGKLDDPALEFVELIAAAHQISLETDGAFDLSVQPLWTLFAEHFAMPGADAQGPADEEIRQALELVGHRHVTFSPHQIALGKSGMALTLNGIAQGFITDRIAGLLIRNGFPDVLVHLGETYAGGKRADGRAWRAGIAAPGALEPLVSYIELKNRALATSGSGGHRFSPDGQHNHLLDPSTGRSANRYHSVSVSGPSATVADALSTAFSIMPMKEIADVVSHRPDYDTTLIGHNGKVTTL